MMTRDEILALEPGRELDALVAENVFDILSEDGKIVCAKCGGSGFNGHGTGYDAVCDCTGGYIGLIPNFSTDISAALEVAETFDFYDLDKGGDYGGIQYSATVETCLEDGTYQTYCARGKAMPESICKAALIAVSSS